ncbi:hypothetical protein [Ponticaulis koreensis]|uniref:hypothetical protein n=1 Tax=Ponticaulis koreensis TaxID=1123045 RepID=UPI0003B64863|nr:hypothetical protein [Ponticaulis koreensis]
MSNQIPACAGMSEARPRVIPDAVQHDNDALLIRDPKHAVSRDQVPCLQSIATRCTAHGMTMKTDASSLWAASHDVFMGPNS